MNAVVKFEKQNIQQRMAARFGVDEREVLAVLALIFVEVML